MVPHSPPSDRRVQTVCLLILTLIAIGVAMAMLRSVLVPFVLALFFVQCLTPLIDLLMKRFRMPHVLAVSIASIVGLGVLTGVGFIVAASVGSMSKPENLSAYQKSLESLRGYLGESRPFKWVGVKIIPEDETLNFISAVLAETRDVLSQGAMVLLLMAFILFGRRSPRLGRSGILAEIEARVQRSISLTVFISTLTGVLVGTTLAILGVQFAAVFGFLAFLLNFIPNVGSVIATILPLPIIFLDPHMNVAEKVLAMAIPSAIQVAIGSLVQPRMLGNSLQLHPVVLLLSLLFFTMIWGVAGAFLATPLTAVIKIVFEKIPATRPLAALLAGDLDPLTRTIDVPPEEIVDPEEAWGARREVEETRIGR
jgi:AI-2 transport protein TqsA